MVHEDFWSPIDFLRGNLVSFSILWCSNFCFIQTWYHHSFCLGMERFCNWTLSTSLLEKRADCQPQMHELYRGSRGMFRREKFLKIGLSETPYSAVPGSNAINSYVNFVELFSESRYSWFPSQSTKIHDSQCFVNFIGPFVKKNWECFVFRNRGGSRGRVQGVETPPPRWPAVF